MADITYIKLFRKMVDWCWFKDSKTLSLFIYILLSARFKEGEWLGQKVFSGQLPTSLEKLSRETGLSIQSIRTCLKRLKSTGEITYTSTSKYTVITVVNWASYQFDECEPTYRSTSEPTNNQQTNNKQITNNQQHLKNVRKKEGKESKNIDKGERQEIVQKTYLGIDLSEIQDAQLLDAIKGFIDMRIKIKKPLTQRAFDLNFNKVKNIYQDVDLQVALLNKAVENSWQGIFPLKPDEVAAVKSLRVPQQAKQQEPLPVYDQKKADENWAKAFAEKGMEYKGGGILNELDGIGKSI